MRKVGFALALGMGYVGSVTLVGDPYAAIAQQPNNEAQAIGQKLIAEINLNIQCNTSLLTLQQEVKRLKDKYEPEAKKD